MKNTKKLLIILFVSFSITLLANDDINSTTKTYKNIDIQKVFNIVKTIYRSSSTEYIFDTSWDKLNISKRSVSMFPDIQIQIDTIILSSLPTQDNNGSIIQLETFKTVGETKKELFQTAITQKLLWNRIEYGLGMTQDWLDCQTSFTTILIANEPLCTIDKTQLQP